jgi:hypothetical protein
MVRKSLFGALVLCASVASTVRAQDFTPPTLPNLTEAKPIAGEGAAPVRPASSMQAPVAAVAPVAVAPAPVVVAGWS